MDEQKYTDDNFKTLEDYYNDGYFFFRDITKSKNKENFEYILLRAVKITSKKYERAKIS